MKKRFRVEKKDFFTVHQIPTDTANWYTLIRCATFCQPRKCTWKMPESIVSTVWIWMLETFEYQTFWSSDFEWFVIQIVGQYSIGYVICAILTIWTPDQYIRKQDGVHLSGIQMFGLFGIQMAFKWSLQYLTRLGP